MASSIEEGLLPASSTRAAEGGRISNVGVMTTAMSIVTTGVVFFVIGLIYVARHEPTIPSLALLVVVAGLGGSILGMCCFLGPKRTFVIHWNEEGCTCRTGWIRKEVHRWNWNDFVGVNLFASQTKKGGIGPFLLVAITPRHELHINALSQDWKKVSPFVEALGKHFELRRYPFARDMYDNGPSVRRRVANLGQSGDAQVQAAGGTKM